MKSTNVCTDHFTWRYIKSSEITFLNQYFHLQISSLVYDTKTVKSSTVCLLQQ